MTPVARRSAFARLDHAGASIGLRIMNFGREARWAGIGSASGNVREKQQIPPCSPQLVQKGHGAANRDMTDAILASGSRDSITEHLQSVNGLVCGDAFTRRRRFRSDTA